MPETVDVTIPVAEAAQAPADARKREAVGRIISRLLRLQPGQDPLLDARGGNWPSSRTARDESPPCRTVSAPTRVPLV